MEDEKLTIEIIEESVINGNRDQAFNQIIEYGYHNFFKDYLEYLDGMRKHNAYNLKCYSDMVDLFIARIDL